MIITSIPDYFLQFDEALSLLRIEWASGDDVRSLRASATQLLLLAQELGTQHWLVNMNTFPDISVYDQVWLGVHWVPGAMKLPLARVVLVNHRRRVHNQMAIDSLISMARPLIRFDIQFFPQAGSGLQWLSDHSPRLPELLAEWEALHGSGTSPADAAAAGAPVRPRSFGF